MLCKKHNKYASNMDDKQIAKKFVEANRGTRGKVFGSYYNILYYPRGFRWKNYLLFNLNLQYKFISFE